MLRTAGGLEAPSSSTVLARLSTVAPTGLSHPKSCHSKERRLTSVRRGKSTRGSDLPTVKSRLAAELKTEGGCDSAETVSPFLTSPLGCRAKQRKRNSRQSSRPPAPPSKTLLLAPNVRPTIDPTCLGAPRCSTGHLSRLISLLNSSQEYFYCYPTLNLLLNFLSLIFPVPIFHEEGQSRLRLTTQAPAMYSCKGTQRCSTASRHVHQENVSRNKPSFPPPHHLRWDLATLHPTPEELPRF